MSWPAAITLALGSGFAGALVKTLVDHFLAERARRRSQRNELGVGAAQSVSDVLESITLLVREYTARTDCFDLDTETWLKLKGDLGNRMVRHVQLIPDARLREELRIIDVCLGRARLIAARLPDEWTRGGQTRHDANVCVDLAVEGLRVIGAYLRGEPVERSDKLRVSWAIVNNSWHEREVASSPICAPTEDDQRLDNRSGSGQGVVQD